jgi:hypothetical protein
MIETDLKIDVMDILGTADNMNSTYMRTASQARFETSPGAVSERQTFHKTYSSAL